MNMQRMTINGKFLVLNDPRNENQYTITHIGRVLGHVQKLGAGRWHSGRANQTFARLQDAVAAEVGA